MRQSFLYFSPFFQSLLYYHPSMSSLLTLLAEESLTMVTPLLNKFSLASGVVKIFAPTVKQTAREKEGEEDSEC
jgi:hypothetical protein